VLKHFFVLLLIFLGGVSIANAQAAPTAERVGDLQIGAGFSNANTDYLPYRVNGFTAYFDFDTRYYHLGLEGEFRFLNDSPSNIYEKTYEIGPRYSRTYGKFVPYGKVLYGRGVFNFADRGVTTANLAYNMFAFGGGVDYKLIKSVNLRGDYEYQKWLSFPPHGLTPSVFTIGAAYHFH
jgi:opacity protein-like surface antigen